MKPTSYEIIEQTDTNVTYTDQDGAEYTIEASKDDNLDQIILGV